MRRRLPPLKSLQVFEAAARRESFKDAADELNVTHSAVSHQIKALEETLGVKLFRRLGRGVRITDQAKRLAQEFSLAFDRIEAATNDLSGNPMQGTLRISIPPFYGNRLVLPRLWRFHELYPNIRVEPDMSSTVLDFRKSDIDAALRYGQGFWPGLTAVEIHRDELSPVAAPSLLSDEQTLPLTMSAIRELTLGYIDGDEGDWRKWFETFGEPDPDLRPTLRYQNRARVIDLAFSGLGVALADAKLTAPDVAAGHLVRLHPARMIGERAMWLVYPETEFPDPRVLAFGKWSKDELEKMSDA